MSCKDRRCTLGSSRARLGGSSSRWLEWWWWGGWHWGISNMQLLQKVPDGNVDCGRGHRDGCPACRAEGKACLREGHVAAPAQGVPTGGCYRGDKLIQAHWAFNTRGHRYVCEGVEGPGVKISLPPLKNRGEAVGDTFIPCPCGPLLHPFKRESSPSYSTMSVPYFDPTQLFVPFALGTGGRTLRVNSTLPTPPNGTVFLTSPFPLLLTTPPFLPGL
jgi:hypothetical protein